MLPLRNVRTDRWWAAYLVCALAAAVPFLVTYRMPMADLPQHAAQATILGNFADTCYRFSELHEINWFTPYLLSTLLTRVIASVVTVNAALKILAWLSVVALPLVFHRIAIHRGLDPWLALLGFPLAFGFTFYWGFINFLLVTPLVLLAILFSVSMSGAMRVAVLALIVAVSHSLAWAVLASIASPFLLLTMRRRWKYLIAVLLPAPLMTGWVLAAHAAEARAQVDWYWMLGPQRVVTFFDHLLSPGGDTQGLVASILIVAIVILGGARLARGEFLWVLPLTAALLYLFVPLQAFGQSFLYQRYAVFVVGTMLIAAKPGKPLLSAGLVHLLIVVVTVSWMLVLSTRFAVFHRDADGFDRLVDTMPSNRRVILLNVMSTSAEVPGNPFLHFSGHYQERKGGVIGWSFASNFPSVVRYKRGLSPGVPNLVTIDPRYFDWSREGNFDYFFVRAPVDMRPLIFREAGDHVRLLRREGLWWLYEHTRRPAAAHCTPLVPDRSHEPLLRLGAR